MTRLPRSSVRRDSSGHEIFYTGDLQSGISLAVSQSKLVGCFVHDDSETSKAWEEDFLSGNNGDLSRLLEEKVVLLKLRQGSQEAGFLSQMYPVYQAPTLVLLGGGLLKLYITSTPPVTKEDFTTRIKAVLLADQQQPAASIPSGAPVPEPQASSSTGSQSSTSAPVLPQASSSTAIPQQPSSSQQSAKLAAEKAIKDQAIKAVAAAKAAKEQSTPQDHESGKPTDPNKKSKVTSYAKQRNERLKLEREDLAKIRKRVEDDKAERKAREAERKQMLNELKGGDGESGEASTNAKGDIKGKGKEAESYLSNNTKSSENNTAPSNCAIQIRLFDGSTIRSRFPATSTLQNDIRPWISQTSSPENKNIPYSFKLVLTPLPNRTIEISEESKEIGKGGLGLVPSATLILVPISGVGVVDAYGGSGANPGIVGGGMRLIGSGVGLVGSGVGMVGSVLGGVLGGLGLVNRTNANTDNNNATGNEDARAARSAAEGSDGPRRENRREFYNGNNLSFEPRRDEDE